MRSWSIGEVARLLGVKSHVIRYWESELPLLSPPKGRSGRREYSSREVELLLKFRHLLYEKKYTVEGARRTMWEELRGDTADMRGKLSEIRAELIEALMTLRARGAEGGTSTEAEVRGRFESLGQGHLFSHWAARPPAMQRRLLDDLASLDGSLLAELRARLSADHAPPRGLVEPAPYVTLERSKSDAEARALGEELVRAGKTAFLTVAGGQGSRLGFDGPKGMFPASPIRRLSLFAILAEKLLAARRWYGADIPWLIMTSPANRLATEEYFEGEKFFGLGQESVRFFSQAILPALFPDGRLVMAADGGLFLSPNGHGGVIEALRREGLLEQMSARGVEELFHFQVDNPLVTVPDPVFLGFHRREGAEVSSKVLRKSSPEEKLGVIATVDGRPSVIEYSDLDDGRKRARDAAGGLLFAQGSIAIHIFNVDFLARSEIRLPYHLARKSVQALNPTPRGTDIGEREAIKMETFVFDAIPLARRVVFFEVERAEEFAPLKNREGVDSVETCARGQIEKAARWLEACGVEVPRSPDGAPGHAIEISPLFALEPGILGAKRGSLKDRIDEDTLLA
jgi:UDP-N-acetylglucosamine/UDP-N-acetylgalactosamine diphosphorylase